ncbi:transketolase [Chitinasiproducens palmae]|uniref:Transketolase n=1 Tax=Chitinasiproducens palmae TaxID=1770053 RepID=A0A1H2PTA2_9BURK|nr:transketolase [Chitinasiproducens palmae]SDV49890.1 transketolase [Chitinasiproducens palmae]
MQDQASEQTRANAAGAGENAGDNAGKIAGKIADKDIEQLAINTIRTLSIDAVQAANSGHPGTPMALAPVAYTLWQRFLDFDPSDPIWPNRDRFVLSVGHASMLLYSLLYLTGVKAVNGKYERLGEPAVSLDDIKRFRQLDSKCPGHPEYRLTSGVETTTGPLGQGVANSVGMAAAQRWLAARYNRPDHRIFDYKVYALCGDGDMMEGISSEAASIAGHLRLSNLCWIYDSNTITIEGHTELAFDEDVGTRFEGYGWRVLKVTDANDVDALTRAFTEFRTAADAGDGGDARPTLIIVNSLIGYGAPHKQNTAAAHGEALGEDEVRLAKRAYGWPEDAKFLVPDGVLQHFADGVGARGRAAREQWQSAFEAYRAAHPDLAKELDQMQRRELPEGWDADIPTFDADAKGLATRESSGKVLNAIAQRLPWLLGGAADLAPSTKTRLTFDGAGDFAAKDRSGRNFHFGIREHAMGAIVNGLALSKLRAYGATFLVFSDYMRTPIRLAAVMEIPSIFVFTHDSIGVGEDGPTHQPVEHLASLRAIPGLMVMRPGDANEVVEAWRVALSQPHLPTCLVLSRQPMPTLDRSRYGSAEGVRRGAYVLADCEGEPDVILMATGSELSLAVGAFETLKSEGVRARVVSMPSWDLFERQDATYRESVLPSSVIGRVAIEQAASLGWDRYTGIQGACIAMHTFGSSAPLKDLASHFGFTAEKVADAAREQAARTRAARGG